MLQLPNKEEEKKIQNKRLYQHSKWVILRATGLNVDMTFKAELETDLQHNLVLLVLSICLRDFPMNVTLFDHSSFSQS